MSIQLPAVDSAHLFMRVSDVQTRCSWRFTMTGVMSSCCWLLPIVRDVVYGSDSYVQELADEVREQALIGDKSPIHHVDDVLNAIQEKWGRSAPRYFGAVRRCRLEQLCC